MISIFEKVHELDVNNEYRKIKASLLKPAFLYKKSVLTFFEFLDVSNFFKSWEYRDTIFTTLEYLEFIGIYKNGLYKSVITEDEFLCFLEFILNMWNKAFDFIYGDENLTYFLFLRGNIDLILRKMGLEAKENNDKIILSRIDADIDSVSDNVDMSINELLVLYTDFRIADDIEAKKTILKKIDLKIEEEKTVYKQIDNETYKIIGKIVNDIAGVNHPTEITDKKQLSESCDDCFKLMIHLIRSKEYKTLKAKYID